MPKFNNRDEIGIEFLTNMTDTITLKGRCEKAGSHMHVTGDIVNKTLIISEF
jgi:hypothetical protein